MPELVRNSTLRTSFELKGKIVKKLHIAISTDKIEETIKDYSIRLGMNPCSSIFGEYALWRTESLNVSVRYDRTCVRGALRHLGWEDHNVSGDQSAKMGQ